MKILNKQMVQHIFSTFFKRGRKGLFMQSSPISSQNSFSHSPQLQEIASTFTGKLLLRSEINLQDTLFQQLLEAGFFSVRRAIQLTWSGPVCKRCNNRNITLFGKIPCLRCGKTHYYCRNCIAMGRITACEKLYVWTAPFSWPTWKRPLSWDGKLTSAQEEAAQQIVQTVKNRSELLIWAVTGSGKTEMIFPGIDYALRQGMRICLASPRADVVRELQPRLKQAFQPVQLEALYSGSKDTTANSQLIIATTHQLLRFNDAFDFLIIDEIDAFPYHQDAMLQFAAERARKPNSARVYLTATPRKNERIRMLFRQLPYVFVPERFHGHPLPIPKFIRMNSLKDTNEEIDVSEQLYTWLQSRRNEKRQLLLFVPTIKIAEKLTKHLAETLIAKQLIDDKNKITFAHAEDERRKEKITAFRNRKLMILVTTTILERGVTFPAIDVVVLGADHHVFDEAALVQIAGRVGRSKLAPTGEVLFFYKNKTEAMVQAKREIILMNERAKKGGTN